MGEPRAGAALSPQHSWEHPGGRRRDRAAGCGQTSAARWGSSCQERWDQRVGTLASSPQRSKGARRQGKGTEALFRQDGTGRAPHFAPQPRCPGLFPGRTNASRKGHKRGGVRRERGHGRGRCKPDPLIPARPGLALPHPPRGSGLPLRPDRSCTGVPVPAAPSRIPCGMQRAAGQG
ncbi:uncharacterized protein LOC127060419 isoform X1 [Serinus canaria]|uniref:uncharacterized protein LOC127060419 isoform X1 n=1 Tax=Serinus canaria TaxID=9135 RepID=UPI0021CC7A93|nr:uncharacterized protein LOC127060419 isoform X1 [Serinus canaria]